LLWGQLTAREHLLFYGRLKNLSREELNNVSLHTFIVEQVIWHYNLQYAGEAWFQTLRIFFAYNAIGIEADGLYCASVLA